MKSRFDYYSLRSKKARFLRRYGKAWVALTYILMLFFGVIGILLLATKDSVGWLFVGLIGPLAMLVSWRQGELSFTPKFDAQKGIDQVLAMDILGRLPEEPTPGQIAKVISKSRAGWFMSNRLGLTSGFVKNIADEEIISTEEVWESALAIALRTGVSEVTGAVLIAALVEQFPSHEALLASLKLEMSDLDDGIRWYERIKNLANRRLDKPMRTGGIARDWSFGWTPTLMRYAQNISMQVSGGTIMTKTDVHQESLDRLVQTFSSGGRQNIALVGPDGSGKSTIVAAFAEMLIDGHKHIPSSLLYQQVFVLDASSLIGQAGGRGELEGLVDLILSEAYLAKNIILCLDNAQLFFEEGVGSVDLGNVLLPILEVGRLRIILTMDEQRFLQISKRNTQLAHTLNVLRVAPADQEETFSIIRDQLIGLEYQYKVTYMQQALMEAYRLGARYVQDLAMPGQALKVLELAASYAQNGLVTQQSVHEALEKTMNIKISAPDSEKERETLLNLEELIHRRMINQTRAVSVVSDAIRRARAGVRNPNRPIGTFLFLGPTGVGKTELAKALADVYFDGEDDIIRLDLNEYVRPEDVSRLIADGADDPMSLTAQISKKPFSVVLLDEIEKAHTSVLTTLLQLLDEGILRDEKNREISFRDAIIIATSNAGADRIREYIERGYQLEQFEEQFFNELISSNLFRPEFLNRFDEMVIFKPLGKEELFQVIDLMLAGVNETLEVQKIQVAVERDGKSLLVESGYDPRLGARPMRRVVQKAVENVVAKQLLAGTVVPGSTTIITADMIRSALGSELKISPVNLPIEKP